MTPPRVLTPKAAAAYLSLPVETFKRLRLGEVRLGPKIMYDVKALDAYLDQSSGLASGSEPLAADNDPEAAFDRSFARVATRTP